MAHPLPKIGCPAGEPVGESPGGQGPGCRCRIERHTLTTYGEPISMQNFCVEDYTRCPTWKRHKELMIWETRARSVYHFNQDDPNELEEADPA